MGRGEKAIQGWKPGNDSSARTAESCQKLERGEGTFSPPGAFTESMVLPASSFHTSSLQN